MKSFCPRCGVEHTFESYPKECLSCNHITYINPIPVAVILCEVKGKGFVLIRRGIEPRLGFLALPGGYVDQAESAEDAARRELFEETGINYDGDFKLVAVESSANKAQMMVFLKTDPINLDGFEFVKNHEVSELIFVKSLPNEPIAFSSHEKYLTLALSLIV